MQSSMSYCRSATFLSCGGRSHISMQGWGQMRIPTLVMWGHVSSIWGVLSGPGSTRVASLSWAPSEGRVLFLLPLSGSAERWSSRIWSELPQTWSDTALACISGRGIFWDLQSVPHLSCGDFTRAWLVLVDPACLLWVSPYSSVSFLLGYTSCPKATF